MSVSNASAFPVLHGNSSQLLQSSVHDFMFFVLF